MTTVAGAAAVTVLPFLAEGLKSRCVPFHSLDGAVDLRRTRIVEGINHREVSRPAGGDDADRALASGRRLRGRLRLSSQARPSSLVDLDKGAYPSRPQAARTVNHKHRVAPETRHLQRHGAVSQSLLWPENHEVYL